MNGEPRPDMARQLCAGLTAAHDRGVLHRDLKPSNIMVDGRGQIRIMDFGLAVATGESTLGELAGTAAYMAPEQLVGDQATERSDLYALGLVFYELFAGHRLFPVRTFEERIQVSHDTSLAHASLPGIDPVIERIVQTCLETDPAERPVSAAAVAAVLPGIRWRPRWPQGGCRRQIWSRRRGSQGRPAPCTGLGVAGRGPWWNPRRCVAGPCAFGRRVRCS
jgi:serine/threonine protein kinase